MSDPIYVVRFRGMHHWKDDFDNMRERFMQVNGDALDGKVVFVDGMVEDVYQLSEQDAGRLVEVLAPAVGYEVRKVDE